MSEITLAQLASDLRVLHDNYHRYSTEEQEIYIDNALRHMGRFRVEFEHDKTTEYLSTLELFSKVMQLRMREQERQSTFLPDWAIRKTLALHYPGQNVKVIQESGIHRLVQHWLWNEEYGVHQYTPVEKIKETIVGNDLKTFFRDLKSIVLSKNQLP